MEVKLRSGNLNKYGERNRGAVHTCHPNLDPSWTPVSGCARSPGLLDLPQRLGLFLTGVIEIPPKLQVQPEVGRHAEISGKSQGRARGNSPPFPRQRIDPLISYEDHVGKIPLCQLHGLEELLPQHFAWVSRLSMRRYTDLTETSFY